MQQIHVHFSSQICDNESKFNFIVSLFFIVFSAFAIIDYFSFFRLVEANAVNASTQLVACHSACKMLPQLSTCRLSRDHVPTLVQSWKKSR